MSPETLMRAYKDCLAYIGASAANTEFRRRLGDKEYQRYRRIAKKIEERILKYASAGHAARERYLHTRGHMKIKGME